MSISNIPSVNSMTPTKESGNILTQAIKDYKDEYLTGLTDEEREKIKEKIKEYLDKIPKGQKINIDALNTLVASLLKKYGYKGDLEDMAETLIGEVASGYQSAATSPTADEQAITAYNKLSAAIQSQKTDSTNLTNSDHASDASTEEDTDDKMVTQTINNPDGSKSIVVTKNEVIISVYKLTEEGDLIKEEILPKDDLSHSLTESLDEAEESTNA